MSGSSDSRGTEKGKGASEKGTASLRAFSPIQRIFLYRLARFLLQRQRFLKIVPESDWRLRLLNKAIYSTYRDCIDQGIGGDAERLCKAEAANQVAP